MQPLVFKEVIKNIFISLCLIDNRLQSVILADYENNFCGLFGRGALPEYQWMIIPEVFLYIDN